MFNNSSEKNRYSLRKLSVGLASVLIGISFIEANGQTAKADTVDGGNTAAISTKVEKTANGAGNAASDANKGTTASNGNLGVAGSANAGQESAKENGSQNYSANDSAEATTAKTEAVKGTITNAKAALDAANGAKDAADEAQTSSTKQQSGNNNAQAAKNTNVEVTKDVQVAYRETQTLDVNKNSKVLDSKALAINLIQDNSTQQDISKITDPSKIDVSYFADGTRWTPAGWTRTDANIKVAKSSNLDLEWINQHKIDINNNPANEAGIDTKTGIYNNTPLDWGTFVPKNISFTIDKNDMKLGNKILVGTIQNIPNSGKQSTDDTKTPEFLDETHNQHFDITNSSGKTIGYLATEKHDSAELDLYFNVTQNIDGLVADPSFTYQFPNNNGYTANAIDGGSFTYEKLFSYKNHNKYPMHYSIVSGNKILNYQINYPSDNYKSYSDSDSEWLSTYDNSNDIQKSFISTDNQYGIKKIQTGCVLKIDPIDGQRPTVTGVWNKASFWVNDAQGQTTGEQLGYERRWATLTKTTDDLTSADLWNNTPTNQAMYSNQKDGSVLVCVKLLPADFSRSLIGDYVSRSYMANVQDPNHYQQILNENVNNIKGWGTLDQHINISNVANAIYQITDVTPSNPGAKSAGSLKSQHIISGDTGHSTADIETYKNVKISYVDDDDNSKSVSSDAMTGRQNKANTYTVNIPKGYYLDDNNTSTGYTWNAEHTQITYTFNADQAKNDANPIEIHLKHIHSAVKDDKYLKNTSVRTIAFDFPAGHGDPETITQTIGWTRTGTYDEVTAAAKGLDEAEKEGNYTDWVFTSDPAATKVTVTVNGKDNAGLASKYQAYDQQAYAKDNSDVEFAAIPIPKIPGYTATFTHDSANPAMLLVSFMALPNTSDATKDDNTEANNPTKPTTPSDDTKPAIDVPVIPSDPKDTVPKSPIATPSVPAEVKDTQDITFDEPVEAPAVQAADLAWHIKDDANDAATYTVANAAHILSLPRFNGYTLRLVKRDAARDAISFVYINPNKTLKYIFNIKLANGKYILTIGKVSEDGIIQLEKVTFSDYNRLIALIAKAVNR